MNIVELLIIRKLFEITLLVTLSSLLRLEYELLKTMSSAYDLSSTLSTVIQSWSAGSTHEVSLDALINLLPW